MAVTKADIIAASERIIDVAHRTPLQRNQRLSEQYGAEIYLKREDLQDVRSFKIRGAYNKMCKLDEEARKNGVVCASAGNHAQGVAYSCQALRIKGTIFMPSATPLQKLDRVKKFGGEFVEVVLTGDVLDDAFVASQAFCKEHNATYVHPFNDEEIIAGQGTVAKEIFEKLDGRVDVIIACIGGGGLISGIATYVKETNPTVKVYGSEPKGAPEMSASIEAGKLISLDAIDTFVDGAAMKRAGELTFEIVKDKVDGIFVKDEGLICKVMVDLYQNEGIVVEPAGALAVAALEDVADEIKGKTVVCTISGGNNDILRYQEILKRSLVYQGLKHYFIVNFAQKPGELRRFLDQALGPDDDIVRFEYVKKTNKETGPALIGVELKRAEDLDLLLKRMDDLHFNYRRIIDDDLYVYHLM